VDSSGNFPIASEPVNSIIIKGVLFPLEPLSSAVVSWNDGKIVSILKFPAEAATLFYIDADRKSIEMEYRRKSSPDRSRVFERWVLE
jgi:hypothetical protein